MPRTPCLKIAERDAQIIARFEANNLINLSLLAEEFETTYTNVHRILRKAGKFDPAQRDRNRVQRRPRARFDQLRAPNLWYSAVGHKIWWWRFHQTSRPEVPRAELATALGISTVRLSQIEQGIALDLTLMEICKIAKCLGTTPEALITPPQHLNGQDTSSAQRAPISLPASSGTATAAARMTPTRGSRPFGT